MVQHRYDANSLGPLEVTCMRIPFGYLWDGGELCHIHLTWVHFWADRGHFIQALSGQPWGSCAQHLNSNGLNFRKATYTIASPQFLPSASILSFLSDSSYTAQATLKPLWKCSSVENLARQEGSVLGHCHKAWTTAAFLMQRNSFLPSP